MKFPIFDITMIILAIFFVVTGSIRIATGDLIGKFGADKKYTRKSIKKYAVISGCLKVLFGLCCPALLLFGIKQFASIETVNRFVIYLPQIIIAVLIFIAHFAVLKKKV